MSNGYVRRGWAVFLLAGLAASLASIDWADADSPKPAAAKPVDAEPADAKPGGRQAAGSGQNQARPGVLRSTGARAAG